MPAAHDNQSSPQLSTTTTTTTTNDVTAANVQPQRHYKSKRNEVQLTDQTNLLPLKKVLASFFGLSLCIVVSTLDSVTVATALPTISAAFNAGSVASWVPSAYMLTSTSFQPLYGRFSDIFGRKVTLTVAMVIFMIGNLAAGFSRNIVELIVFRGFAGAGGGEFWKIWCLVVLGLFIDRL